MEQDLNDVSDHEDNEDHDNEEDDDEEPEMPSEADNDKAKKRQAYRKNNYGKFQCNICFKTFTWKQSLTIHRKFHTGKV